MYEISWGWIRSVLGRMMPVWPSAWYLFSVFLAFQVVLSHSSFSITLCSSNVAMNFSFEVQHCLALLVPRISQLIRPPLFHRYPFVLMLSSLSFSNKCQPRCSHILQTSSIQSVNPEQSQTKKSIWLRISYILLNITCHQVIADSNITDKGHLT